MGVQEILLSLDAFAWIFVVFVFFHSDRIKCDDILRLN